MIKTLQQLKEVNPGWFTPENKKLFNEWHIKKHVIGNNKCEIIKFLNRENGIG